MATPHQHSPSAVDGRPCCSDPTHDHGAVPTGLRPVVERASMPALRLLASLPAWLPFLGMLALMLAGGFVGGVVGAVLLGLAILVVGWLLYLSWPRLQAMERLMRLAVLVLVLAVAVTRYFPQ